MKFYYRWTYSDPSWARIAALLPIVVSCADAGDLAAINILFDAVHELASSVKAVVARLELCGEGAFLKQRLCYKITATIATKSNKEDKRTVCPVC